MKKIYCSPKLSAGTYRIFNIFIYMNLIKYITHDMRRQFYMCSFMWSIKYHSYYIQDKNRKMQKIQCFCFQNCLTVWGNWKLIIVFVLVLILSFPSLACNLFQEHCVIVSCIIERWNNWIFSQWFYWIKNKTGW